MQKQSRIPKDKEAMFVILETLNSLYQSFYGQFPEKIEEKIIDLINELNESIF